MDERRLFGEIAIDRGFITREQLRWALERQRALRAQGQGHKLLGEILVDMMMLRGDQVLDIMAEYDSENPEGDDDAPGETDLSDSDVATRRSVTKSAGADTVATSLEQQVERAAGHDDTERMKSDDTARTDLGRP